MKLSQTLLPLMAFAAPLVSRAAEGSVNAINNPLQADSIEALLAGVLSGVVRIGLIALLLAFIWVGFQFVAAQGSEEKLRGARNALLWTVVGGVILLGAQLIANVIAATASSLAP